MDHQDLALAVILLSAFAGFYLGAADWTPEMRQPDQHESNSSDGFVLGSAHEHALFYVVVNGTELSFLEERYQLASAYVHLENNRSDIVHKHAEGLEWQHFFQTIDLSLNYTDSGICLSVKDIDRCGNGTVMLNGDTNASLDAEISQDDSLVIVLGGNQSAVLQRYGGRQLPPLYKPPESRGDRV